MKLTHPSPPIAAAQKTTQMKHNMFPSKSREAASPEGSSSQNHAKIAKDGSRSPLCFLGVLLFNLASGSLVSAAPAPKLILQITVDQLRGDLPGRDLTQMGEGGFRYLLDNGVVYANAHHAHANTETIVGHATLATGAHPSVHGLEVCC